MPFEVTVNMDLKVCNRCGHTYGYPTACGPKGCPVCVNRDFKDRCEENEHLEKQLSSLRGLNTRLKKQVKYIKEILRSKTLKANKTYLPSTRDPK